MAVGVTPRWRDTCTGTTRAGKSGTAWLAVSFSSDGQSFGSKTWFKAQGFQTFSDLSMNRTWFDVQDHVRLQLYRGCYTCGADDLVLTLHRKRGDA